jgi:hypothetical protein
VRGSEYWGEGIRDGGNKGRTEDEDEGRGNKEGAEKKKEKKQ